MKQKLLLFLFIGCLIASADAQRKQQKTTAYAITAAQKGSSNWNEVRLIDVKTGEVLETIYGNKDEVPTLNARTRKPIEKKEVVNKDFQTTRVSNQPGTTITTTTFAPAKREIITYNIDRTSKATVEARDKITTELIATKKATATCAVTAPTRILINQKDNLNRVFTRTVVFSRTPEALDKPFSTTSAALAYDKKHERLYYTPMGINELRYIDLKSKTTSILYFENEAFGALSSRHDVQNQITRMVIGSDGNGYALTNNANHLIKFTTDKKAVISDLGALTNDPANGRYNVHNTGGGGDMVADEKNNLYLITAGRSVFKISLETRVASYVGSIKGLPAGFSTNGAVVEKGTSIVVSSANSTMGYYKFDVETLQAEKLSAEGSVYNASDLANGNLLEVKKKKKESKEPEPIVEEKLVATQATERERNDAPEILQQNKISVYPNPVAMGGTMKVSFKDQPTGIYTLQFMDIAGKLISSRQVNVANRHQVEDYNLPDLTARGNYLLKVVSDAKQVVSVNKIVVQ